MVCLVALLRTSLPLGCVLLHFAFLLFFDASLFLCDLFRCILLSWPLDSQLVSVLSVALPVGGVLAGPVVGSVLDRRGMFVGFMCVCTLSVLYGVTSFFSVFWVQCVCFVVFSIYRPCLYSAATAYHSVM
jgi:hypothetical protein